MRLNQFEMIVALENCNSLSKAAEKLYMTQPSISKAIRELEDEVGYDILRRKKNGVAFTENGSQVLMLAKEILANVEKIRTLQQAVDESVVGTISLAGSGYYGNKVFSLLVIPLKTHYPNLSIQIQEAFSIDIIHKVSEGVLDFGVIMIYCNDQHGIMAELHDHALCYENCFSDYVGIYARRSHPLHKQGEVTMHDVLRYAYVTGGSRRSVDHVYQMLEDYGYDSEVEIISNPEHRRLYLMANDAVTTMPEEAYISSAEWQKQLLPLRVRDFDWWCEVGIIYDPARMTPLKDRLLIEMLEKLRTADAVN